MIYELDSDKKCFHITNGAQKFNRGIKRDETILVTGDKPCFSLLRTFPEDKLDPDFAKLGDLRVRIRSKNSVQWLDDADSIHTVFRPEGASYYIESAQFPGLHFHCSVSQAEGWGIVMALKVMNTNRALVDLGVEFVYGGLAYKGRTFSAPYFEAGTDDAAGNQIEIERDGLICISSGDMPEIALIKAFPYAETEIVNNRASITYSYSMKPESTETVSIIAGRGENGELIREKIRQADPIRLTDESRRHYESLLSDYDIGTPCAAIDSGFFTAVLNLEYLYHEPAWFEGVHWWNAYWNNNFQISAAVSLGQLDRAKKALTFFANFDEGPGCIVRASKKPHIYGSHNYEDWLPYYLYELLQYYEATGDVELLNGVWDKLVRALKRLWRVRDGNKNGLLDWHRGCNAFMYQADQLAMPGDAASPSLIMAGLLEHLSAVADSLGKTGQAKEWRVLSKEMYSQLMLLLWNDEHGFFYNHVDPQGLAHPAHYYTDLVFPVLYANLPENCRERGMSHLTETLWAYGEYGEPALTCVGDLKPSIFGNDNIMPAQMSETARAYYKTGDKKRGTRLLESVALAGTTFTDAPGNFPERLRESGKGCYNYLFGNPVGSYIYAVIGGLFGFTETGEGRGVRWEPGFPKDWGFAKLRLPYAELSYESSARNGNAVKKYSVQTKEPKDLVFELFLEPGVLKEVICNGEKADYCLDKSYGKTKMRLTVSGSARYGIAVRSVESFALDISELYNTTSIFATSCWRYCPDFVIDLKQLISDDGMLVTSAGTFRVPTDGDYIALVDYGRSDPYTGEMAAGSGVNEISVPVGQSISALKLLFASEVEARFTDCAVGSIMLDYADASSDSIPLVVGKNIDSLFSHYASDTTPIRLGLVEEADMGAGYTDYLNVLEIPCNPLATVKTLRIAVNAPDVQFGLIAVTAVPAYFF